MSCTNNKLNRLKSAVEPNKYAFFEFYRTPIISDGNLIMIGVVIVTVFVIVLILVMINDYRLYLGNHWKKKFSFADFIKQEQFYIYILLFFLLLVGSELLLQNGYSF